MARYETVVEDGTVFVHTGEGRLEVGDLQAILDLVGGPAWTISYTEREKERYPPHVTADEGLTVDVVDAINAMTFGDGFVDTLAAQPAEPVARAEGPDDGAVAPRTGLFVGRLLENLEYGLR